MNHPGYSSPKLADMRRVLDEEPLSDRDRRAVQSALGEIESDWQERHRKQYESGVARRDEQHTEVLDVAEQFVELIAERRDDVLNGRRPAKEVRAWLRDARADFARLTDRHRSIEASEEDLAAFEGTSVEEFQAHQFGRFPHTMAGQVTLGAKVTEKLQRRAAQAASTSSREEADKAQDDLVRELGGRFPATRPRGW